MSRKILLVAVLLLAAGFFISACSGEMAEGISNDAGLRDAEAKSLEAKEGGHAVLSRISFTQFNKGDDDRIGDIEMNYDDDGHLTKITQRSSHDLRKTIQEFAYDDRNRLQTQTTRGPVDSAFAPDESYEEKVEYAYVGDALAHKVVTRIELEGSTPLDTFKAKTEYSYGNGGVRRAIVSSWAAESGQWMPQHTAGPEVAFGQDGRPMRVISCTDAGGCRVTEYTYQEGKLTGSRSSLKNNSQTMSVTYDDSGRASEELITIFSGSEESTKIRVTAKEWDAKGRLKREEVEAWAKDHPTFSKVQERSFEWEEKAEAPIFPPLSLMIGQQKLNSLLFIDQPEARFGRDAVAF